ncbi:MAG: hypothetical protein IT416_00660 [Candidatus Pacebacteria bacterium]|nr:hypothetical protein [Candidatus Paceibacterota bacterium]
MKQKILFFLSVVTILATILSACGPAPAPQPEPPKKYFVPLPPPVNAKFPMTLNYHASLGTQTSKLLSSIFELTYEETSNAVGGTATERYWHLPSGKVGTMQEVVWGDYLGGLMGLVEYYDSNQCLVQGMVVLEVKDATLWQWLFHGINRTFDRGEVALVYEVVEPCGDRFYLSKVQYSELWGTGSILAMGATATWEDPMTVVAPEFHEWGFWETSTTPFDVVTSALDSIRNTLQTQAEVPDLFLVDKDSIQEIIGRQTGFYVYRNGVEIGKVSLTYRHTFGRSPNTNLIGTGALSRIEYEFGDRYYAWVFLTPQVSPTPTSLAILVDSRETADAIEMSEDWVAIYPKLRNNEISGVLLALHMMGDLKAEKAPYHAQVQGGEGGGSVSGEINVGTGGGIKYSVIGTPDHANVALAYALVNSLGKSGLKALGLYFPYKPGSGNGLQYYLSMLLISTAPEDLMLDLPGLDIGVVDRVGFPDLWVFDGNNPDYLRDNYESLWRPAPIVDPATVETPVP